LSLLTEVRINFMSFDEISKFFDSISRTMLINLAMMRRMGKISLKRG